MRGSITAAFLKLLPVLLVASGCSNDAELPTSYHESYLAMPTDVVVVLNGGEVEVSWQIESTANVAAFVVSFTDATGSVESRSVEDPEARTFVGGGLNTESGSIRVQVRAADENDFLGPPSAVVILTID